ncbi:MAG: TIGR03032 family protein [Acidobacteriota bacterium]|nr:TIGR03032 family protein [Acidobacteriota bacterium]
MRTANRFTPQTLTLGTKNFVWHFRNHPGLAKSLEEGRAGAAFVPSAAYATGDIRVHELAYSRHGLRLCTIDPITGRKVIVAEVPGFARGLAFAGAYAFIGLSQVREKLFDGIRVASQAERNVGRFDRKASARTSRGSTCMIAA